MAPPTEKAMEEFTGQSITGTWQEKLVNKFGIAIVGFLAAIYVYVDYKQLNKDQFTYMQSMNNRIIELVESNGKISVATNQALTDLSRQVESSRVEKNKNLDKMDESLTKLIEALNKVESEIKSKTN